MGIILPGDLVTYRKRFLSELKDEEFLFCITRIEDALYLLNKRGFMWSSSILYVRI